MKNQGSGIEPAYLVFFNLQNKSKERSLALVRCGLMSKTGRIVVLVVDDEALLRMSAADALVDDGFIAIEAADAGEALELLDAHPEISVLFSDIQMPGLDGFELARIVCERRPGIRLILTSGRLRPNDDEIPDDGRFIPKPYGAHAVRDMLWSMAT